MTNRLAGENSPYLLQHAGNPVDWYPWGKEALSRAREEDKPIFLSIGYAACHWCHVMAHESFEDQKTAAYLNEHFINIKVDREERPDLDAVYMNAVVSITGQGGWPMSLFLTPDGKPFFGGTYFPPYPRYGMPAFSQVLQSVVQSWKTERSSIQEMGQRIINHIHASIRWKTAPEPLDGSYLEKAEHELLNSYDWQNGGWGTAPKFPRSMAIEFLLQRSTRKARNAQDGLKAAIHALDAMCQGGMYDLVGGGFHRYSTDAAWTVPHFEKMLYDNALLATTYLHASLLTQNTKYRNICEQTLDFILRELTHPDGGFYSSLDADTDGKEGLTYTWAYHDLAAALKEDLPLFSKAFIISEGGNFEGRIILRRSNTSMDELSQETGLPPAKINRKISDRLKILHEIRINQAQPGVDDKVLTGWNGLALKAFAEAARYLHRNDYLGAARKNASFLCEYMLQDGDLFRSWRNGRAHQSAGLEDYAGLAMGLLALYQVSPEEKWYQTALYLLQEIENRFSDPSGGYFDAQLDEDLPVRPKDYQDNALPSGNAITASLLLQFSDLSGDAELRRRAESLLQMIQPAASQYPTGFSFWLQALDYSLGPVAQVAILSPSDSELAPLIDVLHEKYYPRLVSAYSLYPPAPESPYLLKERPLIGGHAAAYVCEQFICRLPAITPQELRLQLGNLTDVD